MNLSMWETMREYIATEIQLALLRYQRAQPGQPWVIGEDTELRKLEEQSTRMETEVRRLIGHGAQREEALERVAILNTPLK